MGNYSKGANGTISGKFGSVIGSSWRHINYLKGLPKKRVKKASDHQLAVQAKFKLSATQLGPISDILSIGFVDKKLTSLTGYNLAVRAFIENSILGEYPDFTINYPSIKLSNGSMPPLRHLEMAVEDNVLTLNWTNVPKRDAFVDDKVIAVIYNKTSERYDVDETAVRADGTVAIDLDVDPGDVLHVWVFCVKRDGLKTSPTQYVGQITINQPS